ncbi:MAG TPA: hypothetical protein VF933_08510, partial [Streptosporangiaceae bacterium]
IEQPTRGWDPVTLTTLTVGLALLAAFAAWEARSRHPVLNVRLFANPQLAWWPPSCPAANPPLRR